MLNETIVNEEFIKEMNKYRKKPEGKGLLQACSENPVLFAEYMLGIKLRAWQIYTVMKAADLIEGKAEYDELLLLTSRQVGKSLEDAIISLWTTIFNKRAKGIENWSPVGIISASDDQAKKLLREIKKLLRLGDVFMAKTYKDEEGKPKYGIKFFSSLLDEKEPNNTDTVTFKAYDEKKHGTYLLKDSIVGSFIKSYPPTSVILGNTYSLVIVDEAGKNDRIPDTVFDDYIGPACDAYEAPVIFTSTAWDTAGFFFEKADVDGEKNDPRINRLMFSIDCIRIEAPRHYAKVMRKVERMNADGKVDEVQRAYYCRFTQGAKSFFSKEKVDSSFYSDMLQLDSYDGPCDMGVDFGGETTSRTVITITRYDEETKKIIRLYHKRYPVADKGLTLISDIKELLLKFNVQRIIPDDCPAGWHLTEKMIREGWDVKPMNFRKDKIKKYTAFRAALNRGNVYSYVDNDLKTEMIALENSESSTQSKIQHAPNYTDDLIDSFVMSAYFFVNEEYNMPSFYEWAKGDSDE